MKNKEIFIGAPSESRELAELIARELDDKGFIPRRWWHEFPAGSYTLDRLREVAGQVDGAVFLGTGVDIVKSRSSESLAPRDNVILEYGLFVGALDRHRCILVLDSECKLPTDCVAITNIRISRDATSVAEKIVKHFVEHFRSATTPVLTGSSIAADPTIAELALTNSTYPLSWYQRQLYYGAEGALNWLALANSNAYMSRTFHNWERRAALELAREASPGTFVSFGPGDGRIDSSVMKMLVSEDRTVRYIPVDICEPLLQRAVGRISKFACTPIGIFGDFEEGLPFIFENVRRYARGPILYSLLGGTLGNFDDSEEGDFLNQMRSIMHDRDRLLVWVSIADEDWTKDKDPRCDLAKLDESFRRFITHSVSKRLQISPHEVFARCDACLDINVRPINISEGATHQVIEYCWKTETEIWPLTRICRYSLGGLKEDLAISGFEVEGEIRQWRGHDGLPIQIAALLIRPRSRMTSTRLL